MKPLETLIHNQKPWCTMEHTDDTIGNVMENMLLWWLNMPQSCQQNNDDKVGECDGTVDNTDGISSNFDGTIGHYKGSVRQNHDKILYCDSIIWFSDDKIGQSG